MIVSLDTAKIMLDIPVTENTDDDRINLYVQGMDSLFDLLCDREFDSAAYAYELHDGKENFIRVKNPPITIAPRVSIGRLAAIQIKNTSTDATYAAAAVDMDNAKINLVVGGGANADDSDVDFATYTTLTTVIAQINTVGKGWVANIADSNMASIQSSALLKGIVSCGAQRNQTPSLEDLEIADDPINIDSWSSLTGQINRSFPVGFENVAVSYTGGYTTATMPHDLKLAALAGIKALYDKGEEDGFGVNSYSDGSLRINYADWLPEITLNAIQDYRREIAV